jgi:uncharacterized membrane protein YhfC
VISNETMTGLALAALIAMLLPFVVFFALRRSFDLRGRNVLIGALVFIVMVVVLEAAMHAYLLKFNPVTKAWFDANAYGFAVYGALAAALFEETGRYLAMRFVAKPVPGSGTPVAYAIGHGGAEAVLIGINIAGVALIGYLMSTGQADSLHLDAATTEQIHKVLDGASFGNALLGGVERISALILQIGLSFIVWQAVQSRRIIFYFAAVALHFAIDFPAAMAQRQLLPLSTLEIEVGYGTLALLVLAAIWAFAPRAQAQA